MADDNQNLTDIPPDPTDLPPDEDLSGLNGKLEPTNASQGHWLRFFVMLGLLGTGIALQSHRHGDLFLKPQDNYILVCTELRSPDIRYGFHPRGHGSNLSIALLGDRERTTVWRSPNFGDYRAATL